MVQIDLEHFPGMTADVKQQSFKPLNFLSKRYRKFFEGPGYSAPRADTCKSGQGRGNHQKFRTNLLSQRNDSPHWNEKIGS
jgi:hypothetical protein